MDEQRIENMKNAYDNVLGDFTLTGQEGLTEVYADPGDGIVHILLFGTIWITLTPEQAKILRDVLVEESR